MVQFVGAEQLIAMMLIEKGKLGQSKITLEELGRYGICVQQMSVENKVNAIFLTARAQIYSAIFDFSDYFKCEEDSDGNITAISIQNTKSVDDLIYRFMGYLPQSIVELLTEAVLRCSVA